MTETAFSWSGAVKKLPPPADATDSPAMPTANACSLHADKYAKVLSGLDNPFVRFLRQVHGLVPTDGTLVVTASGTRLYSTSSPTSQPQLPFFKDDWAGAFAYRYGPTEEAKPESREDPTLRDVLKKAEGWVTVLYNAMVNVAGCNNKPDSYELGIFTSDKLDKSAVEAACRAILTTLVHRCVVGYCGHPDKNVPARGDRKLNCKERLLAITAALKRDKRICRDVLYEDLKISLLVHMPNKVVKSKESQEKSNNRKASQYGQGTVHRTITTLVDSTSSDPMETDEISSVVITSCPSAAVSIARSLATPRARIEPTPRDPSSTTRASATPSTTSTATRVNPLLDPKFKSKDTIANGKGKIKAGETDTPTTSRSKTKSVRTKKRALEEDEEDDESMRQIKKPNLGA